MRFDRLRVVLASILLALAAPAMSGALDTVDVPVADRSADAMEAALKAGLDEVLVRLSGSRDVLDEPVAQDAAEQLDRWVTRHDYRDNSLVAHYDVQGLLGLLSSAGVPVWGLPRPRLLVWLVDQGAGKGDMVSPEHPLYAEVEAEAARRGLSLVFPQWDSEDRNALAVADIRGRFDDRLEQASARYPHEMTVAAVLYSGSSAKVSWRILQGRKTLEQGRLEADDNSAAVARLADELADTLAGRFAVKGNRTEQRTLLTVNGVDSLSGWHSLDQNLKGISGMQQAMLIQVSDASLVYALDFSADDSQLRDLLELSSSLRPCPDPAVPGPQWLYCWQG